MSKRKRPRLEDLLFPKMLEAFDIGKMSPHEAETTIALHPAMRLLLNPVTGPMTTFATMCRTSILFLVEYEEFLNAVASEGEGPVELPPLPYSRIVGECIEDATWAMGNEDGFRVELELFTINENRPGEQWTVCYLVRMPGSYERALAGEGPPEQYLQLFQVNGDGSIEILQEPSELPNLSQIETTAELEAALDLVPDEFEAETVILPADTEAARTMRKLPIEFAHLINARGVTVEEVFADRAQRRRFERKGLVHPQVYFVYIGEGTSDSTPGRSDREYHCRWMVRGHWRHFVSGDKTWVRPYIKGPAGAPWKGRPIYVLTEEVA